MTALLDSVDADGLLEYSVVFSDRSLNHMSASFQSVMRDLSSLLKQVYAADAVALVPGGAATPWRPWRGSSPWTAGSW